MILVWDFAFSRRKATITVLYLMGCLGLTLCPAYAQRVPADRASECRQYLKLALERAANVEDADLQVKLWCGIAELQILLGDKAEAKATYLKSLPLALAHQETTSCSTELRHMARWFALEDDLPQAMQIMSQIKHGGYQSFMLEEIVLSQARTGHFAAALVTAETHVSGEALSAIYAHIALLQAKSGQGAAAKHTFHLAIRVANTLTDPQRKSFMLGAIVQAYARAGDYVAAHALADTLPPSLFHEEVVGYIAQVYAEAGDPKGALALLKNVKENFTSDEVRCSVAIAYIKQKDIVAALPIADSIKIAFWHARALQHLVEYLSQKDDFSQAQTLISQEQSIAASMPDLQERTDAYLSIAEQQHATKQAVQSQATLELVRGIIAKMAKESGRYYQQECLARTQSRLGQISAALETSQTLDSLLARGRMMRRIAFARVHAGEINTVKQSCESLPAIYEQAEGFLGVVDGLCAAKTP